MQRILHIVGGMDRAGAETMIMNLYRHINRTHFQFDFLYFMDKKCDYDEEIEQLGGKIFRISESNPISRTFKIYKFLKENKEYKIVHSHTLLNSGFNLLGARLAGVQHRIAHSHSTTNSNLGFTGNLYGKVAKFLIKRLSTDRIACGNLPSKFLFDNSKAHILLNAIDIEQYQEIANCNKKYIKNDFNLALDTLVIIQVGRLQKVKNHHFSLDIMKGLKESGIDFKFFIIGQGDLEEDLKNRVKHLGLEDEVIFTGIRSDVPHLMAGADLMLMPSFHEGFPVVLVESQAIGLPTIVSDNVSKEVDLGLDLIHFEAINNLGNWINKIAEFKKSKSNAENAKVLKKKGFDVKSNATWLQQFYKMMN